MSSVKRSFVDLSDSDADDLRVVAPPPKRNLSSSSVRLPLADITNSSVSSVRPLPLAASSSSVLLASIRERTASINLLAETHSGSSEALQRLLTDLESIEQKLSNNLQKSPPALPVPRPLLSLGPPPGHQPTKQYVFDKVWSHFTTLHKSQPKHPIFGSVTEKKIAAPLTASGRATSWKSKMVSFAAKVQESNGLWIKPGDCWMRVDNQMSFQQKVKGSVTTLCTFGVVRLLAFVANPTDANWNRLTGQLAGSGRSTDSPFLHFCHNGHGSKQGRVASSAACVNRIEHGRFGTVKENVDQKSCKDADRASCPGHGQFLDEKCVFVHSDGAQKPCLNLDEGRPAVCVCERKCF